MGIAVSIYFR